MKIFVSIFCIGLLIAATTAASAAKQPAKAPTAQETALKAFGVLDLFAASFDLIHELTATQDAAEPVSYAILEGYLSFALENIKGLHPAFGKFFSVIRSLVVMLKSEGVPLHTTIIYIGHRAFVEMIIVLDTHANEQLGLNRPILYAPTIPKFTEKASVSENIKRVFDAVVADAYRLYDAIPRKPANKNYFTAKSFKKFFVKLEEFLAKSSHIVSPDVAQGLKDLLSKTGNAVAAIVTAITSTKKVEVSDLIYEIILETTNSPWRALVALHVKAVTPATTPAPAPAPAPAP